MPKDTQKHGGARQRPISCRFCRTRKLRCSRDSPCSNCVSRNIPCELEQFNNATPTTIDNHEKEELLERIRKLEALVETKSVLVPSINTLTPSPSVETQLDPVLGDHAAAPDHMPSPNAKGSATVAQERLDEDCAYLKNIFDGGESTPDEIPSATIGFRICALEHIRNVEESTNEPSTCFSKKIFWLPEYPQAKLLLDKFESNIHHMHHILPSQSLIDIVDRVYSSLSRQGEVKSGDMVLLFAIFTASMHTWSQDDCCRLGLFKSSDDARRKSLRWAKAAEHLLQIAQKLTKISIGGITGIIILGFVAASYKGFSRECWFFMNMAILHARDCGLHCIDHPSNAEFARTANAEVGRRMWWYCVSTDWAMSLKFNGLARGTYQCHPRQMMTNKPLNVDDEDVVDGMPRVGKPLSQPTAMSYFLFRVRLNEITRNLVDRTPFVGTLIGGPSFDVVMDIDTEMQQLHNDIPSFFALHPVEMSKTYNMEYAKALSIARQGSDFYALFYAQRCRLHLPFARRGYTEPEYAPSRDMCVQSARLIIRNETKYHQSGLNKGGSRYIPLFYSMTVFLACTVLLMDYSYTRSSLQREKQKVEICDAVRLLEMARSESELAAQFMDTMVAVLQKHGITPIGRVTAEQPQPMPSLWNVTPSHPSVSVPMAPPVSDFQHTSYVETMPGTALTPLSVPGTNTLAAQELDNSFTTMDIGGSDLNDLVRSLDHSIDVGTIDWDDIFVGLEPSLM